MVPAHVPGHLGGRDGILAGWQIRCVCHVSGRHPVESELGRKRSGTTHQLALMPQGPHWSPDGTRILFYDGGFGAKSHGDTISAQGDAPVPMLVNRGEQGDSTWSPDGMKIAFASGGPQSVPNTNIQILDLSSHEATKISGSDGLRSPRWSPTGSFIAALTTTSSLAIFDFNTQRWSVLEKGICEFPTWSRDGRFLFFRALRIIPVFTGFRYREERYKN
jgi:Tol biopolymer transport system component